LQDGLDKSRPDQQTRRRLAQTFVNLSQAYRDLVIDFSITLFDPKDVLQLRNLTQGVVRALLSLKSDTRLFNSSRPTTASSDNQDNSTVDEFVIDIDGTPKAWTSAQEKELLAFVVENLAEPTENLFFAMRTSLQSCDAVLMEMCGHRKYLGPPSNISSDVVGLLVKLRKRIIAFSEAQSSVLNSDKLPMWYTEHPEVAKLFAFCRPVHQAATAVEALAVKVNEMQQRKPKNPKLYLPSYPFWKSLHRTNAQVRHDRGGLTAGKLSEICLTSFD
jgi:hypothetical protein